MHAKPLIVVSLFFLLGTSGVWAQSTDTDARLKALEDQIHALQEQVQALQTVLTAPTPAAAPAGAPQPAVAQAAAPQAVPVPAAAPSALPGESAPASLPVYGGASSMAKALNPDISVIGNFIGGVGRNPLNPFPAMSMRESEFGFQAIVDPYARADFFLSVDEGGASVEEGYLTFLALPAQFQLRVGQMRADFGKINQMHNHVLPWLDRPLVTTNILGGDPAESDAGIKDAGFSLSRIIPGPAGLFIEATGELYRGTSGTLFDSSRHSDVSTVDHVRAYHDIGEETNVEIGGSYARGFNDVNSSSALVLQPCTVLVVPGGTSPTTTPTTPRSCPFQVSNIRDITGHDFITQLFGVDATVRWKPLRRSIYHSFVARTEFDWSLRNALASPENGLSFSGSTISQNPISVSPAILPYINLYPIPNYPVLSTIFTGTDLPRTTLHAHGFYSSADYQFARRWFVGGRFDWSQRARFPDMHDSQESLVVTYWPSEFSQVRGQLRRTNYAEGIVANELLFQFQFSIGAHGAHPF